SVECDALKVVKGLTSVSPLADKAGQYSDIISLLSLANWLIVVRIAEFLLVQIIGWPLYYHLNFLLMLVGCTGIILVLVFSCLLLWTI
ncbi:hypothetical protein PanWU01x14_344170, partial [Parasponia andersonii]